MLDAPRMEDAKAQNITALPSPRARAELVAPAARPTARAGGRQGTPATSGTRLPHPGPACHGSRTGSDPRGPRDRILRECFGILKVLTGPTPLHPFHSLAK